VEHVFVPACCALTAREMACMRLFFSTLIAIAALAMSRQGFAQPKAPVAVWPTLTPAGDGLAAAPLHRPEPVADKDVFERAQELDATLRDAVQDLGFTLYVADPGPSAGHTRDEDLLARAARSAVGDEDIGTWVVSPRIEATAGDAYLVRIVVALPNGHELRVRVETAPAESVGVRGLVMLRDLLSPSAAAQAATERDRERAEAGESRAGPAPPRSAGRAVLAVNAALFGGFTSFSLQQSSGSTDPRVLYPLLALGAGIGVGSALLVADEWNITTGDAWYLSAGAWWGAGAGFLIAAGRHVLPLDDRYTVGIAGGLLGASLATATLAFTRQSMDDGDAILTHSGAAYGLLMGGAAELLYRGQSTMQVTPYTGSGYGTAIGLLGAGALATRIKISPSRLLLIDLGVGGGALVGAAIASPLIFQNATPTNTRGWLTATMVGSVVGGVATWWLTRDAIPARASSFLPPGSPTAGVIGETATVRGSIPVYGVGWAGPM
jgi:hypothetical protein